MYPKPTFGIWLDKRRAKKNGKFPVKLWVRIHEKQIPFPAKIDLTEKEWTEANKPVPKGKSFINKKIINSLLDKIDQALSEMETWDINEFKLKVFHGKKSEFPTDLEGAANFIINQLREDKRVGTAASYATAIKSIKAMYPNRILLKSITVKWLEQYEAKMLEAGKSRSTIGIYLRALRAIINKAIVFGVVMDYPFGKGKYKIPTGANPKRGLTTDELKQLLNPKNSIGNEAFPHALWRFVYYANGINTADLIKLKFSNIVGNEILYTRQKTERYMKNKKVIHIPLIDPLVEIINLYGGNPGKSNFIFPILEGDETPEQIKKKTKDITRRIHYFMTKIAKRLGINKKISVLTARHSFGTTLKRANVPLSYIQDAFGHKDIKTTENYLGDHEEDMRMKYNNKLID